MRFAHVWTRARMVNVGLFIQKQNKMEIFQFVSAVCGCHIYKDIWEPSVGEKRIAHREFGNQFNKFAIKMLNGEEKVGHLPHEYSRIAWYFLARGGSITLVACVKTSAISFSACNKGNRRRLHAGNYP